MTNADFSEGDVDDATLITAQVDLFFQPSSFSRFDIRLQRELDDLNSFNSGDLSSDTIDDDLAITWRYDWSSFVTTRASFAAEWRRRDCPTIGTQTTSAGFEIGLKPRRWIELGAGVQADQRSDDDCQLATGESADFSYDRQIFNVFVRATL